MGESFGAKLAMVLKALTVSSGRVSSDLGIDKSVVSRWLSGAVRPSVHNLARLTAHIAERVPGFSMLDWELEFDALQALVAGDRRPAGAAPSSGAATLLGAWPPRGVLEDAAAATALRGASYEGFWRSTRLSNEAPGRFVHDQILIRKSSDGLLQVRTGVIEMRFEGVSFPSEAQLVGMSVDAESGVFIFSIFNGVLRSRADFLDGLTLTITRLAGGTAVAGAVVMERVGDLSGDETADDATFEASIQMNPLAPEGSVPERIRAHLFKDVGPTAFAAGGAALLNMAFANSLSSGSDPRRTRAA